MELRRPVAPAVRMALALCPFCGVAPEGVAELRRYEGMATRTLHQVVCRCGAAGPIRPVSADAAAAWEACVPIPPGTRTVQSRTAAQKPTIRGTER